MSDETRTPELEEFEPLAAHEQAGALRIKVIYGLFALTRLGERPVTVQRLAALLGRSADEAAELAWDNLRARTEDGLIHVDLSSVPEELVRRRLRIGDREIGMGGCAPDLFGIAAVLDVPFQVEDTCSATGTPIRIDFIPGGVERVDPPETVVSVISPDEIRGSFAMAPEEVNALICSQMGFFASPQAAADWLAEHPTGRVLSVDQMLQLDTFTQFRATFRPLLGDPPETTTSLDTR